MYCIDVMFVSGGIIHFLNVFSRSEYKLINFDFSICVSATYPKTAKSGDFKRFQKAICRKAKEFYQSISNVLIYGARKDILVLRISYTAKTRLVSIAMGSDVHFVTTINSQI